MTMSISSTCPLVKVSSGSQLMFAVLYLLLPSSALWRIKKGSIGRSTTTRCKMHKKHSLPLPADSENWKLELLVNVRARALLLSLVHHQSLQPHLLCISTYSMRTCSSPAPDRHILRAERRSRPTQGSCVGGELSVVQRKVVWAPVGIEDSRVGEPLRSLPHVLWPTSVVAHRAILNLGIIPDVRAHARSTGRATR